MAADIQLDWAAGAAYSITINNVADGAFATPSAAVDLGDPAPLELVLEFIGSMAASGGTDFVEFYMLWSHDNTDFTDNANGEFVRAVKMNGTNQVKAVFSVPVKAQYHKLGFKNEGNAAMAASGCAVTYVKVAIDQA